MWVIVYCNDGFDSGMVYLCRELADDELLIERAFADEIARQRDAEIEDSKSHLMNCEGDLRVEFLDYKPRTEHDSHNDCERYLGSTRIWSGESFYFKREDY